MSRRTSYTAPPPYANVVGAGKVHPPTQNNHNFWSTTSPPPSNSNTVQPQQPFTNFYNPAVQSLALSSTPAKSAISPTNSSPISAHRRQNSSASTASWSTQSSSSSRSSQSENQIPPGFTRLPRIRQGQCQPFPPMYLLSKSQRLEHGFPLSFPTLTLRDNNAHPFSTRDVDESDWFRYVYDRSGG